LNLNPIFNVRNKVRITYESNPKIRLPTKQDEQSYF
jgi:hypothetical protein